MCPVVQKEWLFFLCFVVLFFYTRAQFFPRHPKCQWKAELVRLRARAYECALRALFSLVSFVIRNFLLFDANSNKFTSSPQDDCHPKCQWKAVR